MAGTECVAHRRDELSFGCFDDRFVPAFSRRSQALFDQQGCERLPRSGVERVIGDLGIRLSRGRRRGQVGASLGEQVPAFLQQILDHFASLLPAHLLSSSLRTSGTSGRERTSRKKGSSSVAHRSTETTVGLTSRWSRRWARSAASYTA